MRHHAGDTQGKDEQTGAETACLGRRTAGRRLIPRCRLADEDVVQREEERTRARAQVQARDLAATHLQHLARATASDYRSRREPADANDGALAIEKNKVDALTHPESMHRAHAWQQQPASGQGQRPADQASCSRQESFCCTEPQGHRGGAIAPSCE
jgi:hypothetical protein